MLTLTRKVGEELVIAGTEIRVRVVRVRGKRVQIGVTAPARLTVRRGESLRTVNALQKPPLCG